MCEERGGSLACDATFSTLVVRADLIESFETVFCFFRMQPSGQNIPVLADLVHGQSHSLKGAIKYFLDVTTYLAGFLNTNNNNTNNNNNSK